MKCGKLGGKDDYCRKHRPADKRANPFREEIKPDFGYGFTTTEETKDFGIERDFGMCRRWGNR